MHPREHTQGGFYGAALGDTMRGAQILPGQMAITAMVNSFEEAF
ncbi:hypothetical protein [Anaerotruncus colihominis]|uniref:Uncharacterized protein n=1 Tax=Anaerotruncus colihominis DSM 17241 TaxID=445972 RepID=B0P5K7_9FIRM|nr:hypothetical protein [Anaerotruncus colihominis]EDS13240.1 hypothetical protein ANACOL_00028 [Anaerotruncus colihominis DSM 17241]UWN74765.1 hypothetical protein NQ528_16560 [Anaerotruncus colihominis]